MSRNDFGKRVFAPGVVVSNDTRTTGLNNNDLIIGGTGSGKTGGYIYNLLSHPYGSMVVSDTKGRLHRLFADSLIKKGYKVVVLDFVNPRKSIGYNPLSYIRKNQFGEPNEADILKLASCLMPVLDKSEPFWEKSAVRYIAMLIGYVLEEYDETRHTMSAVVELHHMMQDKEHWEVFSQWADNNAYAFAARKFHQEVQCMNVEKMWGSIMEFANQALDIFDNREFSFIWDNENTLDIARSGFEKTVIFLNSSDNDTSTHMLCNIFNTQAMQALIAAADSTADGCLPIPCRLILDDFAAACKIENFDNLISIIRSREISVSVIIQSLSQLNSMYSPDSAKTILNNCAHVLYLSGRDMDTMNYIANFLNITVHSVLTLPRDKAVFIEEGAKARVVQKLTPYKEQSLKAAGSGYGM